jgi:two-component sensor histidine kinase
MRTERDRLNALREYRILDAPIERDFADFVAIASDICRAPTAAINLIDRNRHWTLSGIGIGNRELPLDQSICAKAIEQNELFVVPDLAADPDFLTNPLVAGGPKFRFYAGAILETPAGVPLGTVCVLDSEPRPGGLTPRERFTMQALARQIVTQLELRRAMRAIKKGDVERQSMRSSLDEKDALLKEIHHRVKNNLQLISSLLNLQASRIGDPAVAAILGDSRNRVRAMSLVHENLYGAGNFAQIPMRRHIQSLCSHLRRAFGSASIQIKSDCDDIMLDLDRAIACGLIVNELVSNSLKHGFPCDRPGPGHVEVILRSRPSEGYELIVADDGVGISGQGQDPSSMSLGLQLVRDLAKQLNGSLSIVGASGTICSLTFGETDKTGGVS